MNKELLKKKILKLYSKPVGYYTSELSERFDVEPMEIIRAIKELKEEGKWHSKSKGEIEDDLWL